MARRFDLPNTPEMQDWESEVADPSRIDESLDQDPRWQALLDLLETNIDLHIYSVWNWSDLDNDLTGETRRVAPYIRKLHARLRARFENPA